LEFGRSASCASSFRGFLIGVTLTVLAFACVLDRSSVVLGGAPASAAAHLVAPAGAGGGSGSRVGKRAGAPNVDGLVGCDAIAPAFVEARLRAAVARRTVDAPSCGAGGAPFTASSVARVHACARGAWALGFPDLARDFFFLVMGSSLRLRWLNATRRTWASLLPRARVWAVGDARDAGAGLETLPELAGRASYEDAQHRSLRGLQHAVRAQLLGGARWVVLLDDDTYANALELPGFLVGWDARVPLLFGHIWYGPEWRRGDEGAWPSGGAGVILSRRAAELLADALYGERCPFLGFNDMTLGACATRLGIPMVHVPGLDPHGNALSPMTAAVKRKVRPDGSFVRPHSCLTEGWVPSANPSAPRGPQGEELLPRDAADAPATWTDGVELVVTRAPLLEVYSARTLVESTLFFH
jgi:hypothetical protein